MRPGFIRPLAVLVVLATSAVGCSDDGESARIGGAPSSISSGSSMPGGGDREPPEDASTVCDEPEGASPDDTDLPPPSGGAPLEGSLDDLVPEPVEVAAREGDFVVGREVVLVVTTSDAETAACFLRDQLARSTGLHLAVRKADVVSEPRTGEIRFMPDQGDAPADGGPAHPEGYRLVIDPDLMTVEASTPAGHTWAVQTLLQSAAPAVHSPFRAEAPISFPAGSITDAPRFGWRGLMVDIARHWFGPTELMRVIDLMSAYKLNVLHLHLTDDQGWRLAIEAYPALTELGARTQVGGGDGGFLSQDDYRRIVAHAEERGITVVPEIDLPGHTNAALHSVPELNCDGVAPEPYTGTSVGFSSLCIGDPDVDEFVRTVLTELAGLTPGPFIHVGGDEAHSTEPADYQAFMSKTLDVVRDLGKVPIGWEEVGSLPAGGELIAQHWLDTAAAEEAVGAGASVVLSPSSVLYFDMAYGPFAPNGNSWAGTTDTREVYEWDPASQLDITPSAVRGVEAALWTELVETSDEIDLRLLPRLPALAEVAWSAPGEWEEFRTRLASHRDRWRSAGRSFVDDPGLG